jgi:hypothetical protein
MVPTILLGLATTLLIIWIPAVRENRKRKKM